MTLRSSSEIEISTFTAENYHQMYHLPQLVRCVDTLFYATHNQVNMRDIVKCLVKETSKFRQTPDHVYKTKSLRKAYELLIIFACGI